MIWGWTQTRPDMGQNDAINEPESDPNKPRAFAIPWPPLYRGKVALRPWGASPKDPEFLAAAWADPEIARWTKVPDDHGREAAKRWIEGEGVRRDSGLALDLAITEAGSPEVVFGEVGLVLVEQDRRWAEIGYWLFPGVRGSGIGAAAVDAFADWVIAEQDIKRVFARINPANPASERVVEKAGFTMAGEMPDGTRVWALDAPPPPSMA